MANLALRGTIQSSVPGATGPEPPAPNVVSTQWSRLLQGRQLSDSATRANASRILFTRVAKYSGAGKGCLYLGRVDRLNLEVLEKACRTAWNGGIPFFLDSALELHSSPSQ